VFDDDNPEEAKVKPTALLSFWNVNKGEII
jgi:hypothetical protein